GAPWPSENKPGALSMLEHRVGQADVETEVGIGERLHQLAGAARLVVPIVVLHANGQVSSLVEIDDVAVELDLAAGAVRVSQLDPGAAHPAEARGADPHLRLAEFPLQLPAGKELIDQVADPRLLDAVLAGAGHQRAVLRQRHETDQAAQT